MGMRAVFPELAVDDIHGLAITRMPFPAKPGFVAHTDDVTAAMDRGREQGVDFTRQFADFRPSVASQLRENLSVLRYAGALLPRPFSSVALDPDRVPVLLVPGFLSGDFAMAPMSDALRRVGHWTSPSGIAPNIGCTRVLADLLEGTLVAAAQTTGRRVAIVGWSRGGTLGKIIAIRRPELVSALITLGTPNTDPLAINPTLALQLQVLTRLTALGVPGLLGDDCLNGDCAAQVLEWLDADFPKDVPYVSAFSMTDAVIDWRACLDPAARHVEVESSHMAMGAEPAVIDLVRSLLIDIAPEAVTL